MNENKRVFLKKNLPLLAVLFILGIIFLYIAEYDSNKRTDSSGVNFDEKAYTEQLEARLCSMLEKMDGVEDVQVMITLESISGYQFTDRQSGLPEDSTLVGSFLQDSSAVSKNPIQITVGSPKIKGVSVVCSGAKNVLIRGRIINLISSTLNLTKNKIYVTE